MARNAGLNQPANEMIQSNNQKKKMAVGAVGAINAQIKTSAINSKNRCGSRQTKPSERNSYEIIPDVNQL